MTDPVPSGLSEEDDPDDIADDEPVDVAAEDSGGAEDGPPVADSDAGGGGGLRSTPVDDRVRAEAWDRRLVALEDRVVEAQAAVAAATQAAARAGARAAVEALEAAAEAEAAGQPEPAPEAEPPKYQALAEFVMHEFTPLYGRRRQGGRWRWCERWWEHAEAVSRLRALHLAWEAMSDDSPTGLGDWYRNHLDHQLPILMGADGPFRRCDAHHYPDDPDDALICGIPRWDHAVWRTD